MRSTTPPNEPAAIGPVVVVRAVPTPGACGENIGIWIAIGVAPRCVVISAITRAGSAPVRSHLLMNARRGVL